MRRKWRPPDPYAPKREPRTFAPGEIGPGLRVIIQKEFGRAQTGAGLEELGITTSRTDLPRGGMEFHFLWRGRTILTWTKPGCRWEDPDTEESGYEMNVNFVVDHALAIIKVLMCLDTILGRKERHD